MLTRLEMKILNLVYNFSCRFITIPFRWKNAEMSLKSKPRIPYIISIRLLILFGQVLKTSIMFQIYDINGLIFGGLSMMGCACVVIFQINIWLYQTQFVELINQILHVNSTWGKKSV